MEGGAPSSGPAPRMCAAWVMSCSSSHRVSCRKARRMSGTLVRRISFPSGPSCLYPTPNHELFTWWAESPKCHSQIIIKKKKAVECSVGVLPCVRSHSSAHCFLLIHTCHMSWASILEQQCCTLPSGAPTHRHTHTQLHQRFQFLLMTYSASILL